jgi:hypothetical protein
MGPKMPAKGGKNSPFKLTLSARRTKAVALRKKGLSFEEIAETISKETGKRYSKSMAHRDVTKSMEDYVRDRDRDSEQILTLELMRLDALQSAWWPHAVGDQLQLQDGDGRTSSPGGGAAEGKDVKARDMLAEKRSRWAALQMALNGIMVKLQSSQMTSETGAVEVSRDDVVSLRGIVSELRKESESTGLPKPDREAAEIVMRVIDRRSRMLGLDKLVLAGDSENPVAIAGAFANVSIEMTEEELDHAIANIESALGAIESGAV